MKISKIICLLYVTIFLCSCTKSMEDKGLESVINYGVASSLFYKDCFCQGEMGSKIDGKYPAEVFCFDDETYGKRWMISFKDFGNPIFSALNIKYQYTFVACISADDLDLMLKSEKCKKSNCVVEFKNVTNESLVGYFDKENLVIKNIKNNLHEFVGKKKAPQSFYVGPFGDQSSTIHIYWKEEGKMILIERQLLDDPYVKKLNFAGITVRDFKNEEVIDRILKDGVLITVK